MPQKTPRRNEKRLEDDSIIASCRQTKKQKTSGANCTDVSEKVKRSTRKDSLCRRVSTSANQSTLDLEDELFSPSIKLAEEKRLSFRHCRYSTDSDSSYSNISVSQDVLSSSHKSSPNVSIIQLEEPNSKFTNSCIIVADGTTVLKPSEEKKNISTELVSTESVLLLSDSKEDEELDDETYSMIVIKTLPPYTSIDSSLLHRQLLPPKSRRNPEFTMVLDLDETLVHCVMEPVEDYDKQFEIDYNGEKVSVYALFRPFLQKFLKAMAAKYEIVVFTASQRCYADALLDIVDPNNYVKHRLYRQHCLLIDENYLKDLVSINRDLKKTVILDNSIYAFGYQIDNGIPMSSWFDNKDDTELSDVIPFLEKLTTVNDVRPIIRTAFEVQDKIDSFVYNP